MTTLTVGLPEFKRDTKDSKRASRPYLGSLDRWLLVAKRRSVLRAPGPERAGRKSCAGYCPIGAQEQVQPRRRARCSVACMLQASLGDRGQAAAMA